MKQLFKRTTAAVCCGILTAAFLPALSASADSGNPIPPIEPEYMTALYDDYDPVGDDVLCIQSYETADVKIVQHSPERENLVLFDCIVMPLFTPQHIFKMEPGDYTIYISVKNVADGVTKTTYTADLTIDNADYSVAPDQFDYTYYDIVVTAETIEDDAEAAPQAEEKAAAIVSDHKYVRNDIVFGRYSRKRGDYDGNGEISALDAQNVLRAYAAALTEDPDAEKLTNAQLAACDIDGNGEITALDAQNILMYYSESIVGGTPEWPNAK